MIAVPFSANTALFGVILTQKQAGGGTSMGMVYTNRCFTG
jgi:hypothetical protein